VHLVPANASDLRVMTLYGCKSQEFTSATHIKSYFEATRELRMISSGGVALRGASAKDRKIKKARKCEPQGERPNYSGRQTVLPNVNARSHTFQDLLWRLSPDFAKFAEVI
jgi:hypothetical protein